ncbi:MAG: hypothetical protein IPG42_12150 [Betaproteobacteria bacterium]|nr:hypothetical protein [Betaproteobacteria bacterium]
MRTLITCGTPWCQLKSIQDTLIAAGVSAALDAQSGSVVGIGPWHDRLFSGLGQVLEARSSRQGLGTCRGEILLANWDQAAWGWADSRSTWLLEFWRDFDPSTCFVLVHTPAQDILKQILTGDLQGQCEIQTVLDTWLAYQTEMLRFYHRNRSRCVLVHSHQALHADRKWVATLNDALGTEFNIPGKAVQITQAADPLLHLLVQGLLDSRPDVRELEEEIRATLPENAETQSLPVTDILAAGASLQALYGKEALLLSTIEAQEMRQLAHERESGGHIASLTARLHDQGQLNDRLAQELASTHAQLNQAVAQLADAYATQQDLEAQLTAVQGQAALVALEADQIAKESKALAEENAARQAAHLQEAAQLRSTVQEQSQESELLLLQLHQVQEELEQHFLSNQDLKTQLSTLKTSNDALVTERDPPPPRPPPPPPQKPRGGRLAMPPPPRKHKPLLSETQKPQPNTKPWSGAMLWQLRKPTARSAPSPDQ